MMNMKRLLSLILVFVMGLGMIPVPAFATEGEEISSVDVVLSLSADDCFMVGPGSGAIMAMKEISVPYFDLALYGLEEYYFVSEDYGDDGDGMPGSDLEPGTPEYAYGKVTLLHLYIYALEVFYCGIDPDEAGQGYLYNEGLIGTEVFSISGGVGSSFLNQFWGGDCNLNYYVNYEYPLASTGWGATADQILLREGDIVTLGQFTGWSFYGDPYSIFNYITADNVNPVKGQEITLTLYYAGADMGGAGGTAQNLNTRCLDVYYAPADNIPSENVTDWEYIGTSDENGQLVVDTTALEAGEYIFAVAGQPGEYYPDEICSTPGGVRMIVENPVEEPVTKYGIDVSGSNGTVEADKEEAAVGETVTLTVTPNDGYEFSSFWVLETENYDEVSIEFTELGNNQYSFAMPAHGLDITGIFALGAASVDDAGFVIKVNDVEMELVDGGSEVCTSRYVSNLFRIINVTVPYGTTTVTVERTNDENSPNIQYMSGTAHSFGGNAMPTFEADVVNYDGLCISCGGKYYHVTFTVEEKPGAYQCITTDMEGDVLVTEQEMIEGWIPYYHAVVPRGSSYAYVTYPADTIYVYGGQALVVEYAFDYSYSPQKQWPATENADGSVTVAVPITDLLVEETGTGYAVCFWKANGGDVLEGFTFSYAEDTTIFLVTLAAGNGYTTDGAGYVKTGEEYSFTVDIKNGYDATNMMVKVNGEVVTPDENGVYTVYNVTSDLVITVEGVEAIPSDGDVTFYFSVEEGDHFVEQGGVVWALEEVTVPYFDLAAYGMEYLYYNPDCYSQGQASQAPGTKEQAEGVVTMLHALIWLTEVYYNELDPADAGQGWLYENGWPGFSVYSATAGSAFFFMWDFSYNFNYYVNYEYPLGYPGWGATCDQIKLSDGDVLSMRYNDNSGNVGTYHHFGEKALVTKTVNKGQSLDLDLYRTGEDYANYTTPVYLVGEGHNVYLFAKDEIETIPASGTLMGSTDENGTVTIDTTDLEPGTYYLVSNSTSPAVMLLTVEAGEEPKPESSFFFTITADGNSVTIPPAEEETAECFYEGTQKVVVTLPAGTQNIVFAAEDTYMSIYAGEDVEVLCDGTAMSVTIAYDSSVEFYCVHRLDETYHVYFEMEGSEEPEPTPEYKSEYGITVLVGGEEMDLVDNGTENCGVMQAQKLNVTVPAGTTEVIFLNITDTVLWGQMYIYSGAHDWTEYASNVTEAAINLAECGTSFCISDSANNWYHVNIVVELPPHEHSYKAIVTAPTCTEAGFTTYTCECGDSYTADETAALGHDWKGTSCGRCAETRENPFTDVPEDSFYIDPVLWAVENGITNGATETTFNPTGDLLRAQVVTMLWRHAGSPVVDIVNPFTDVKEGEWYYNAVLWAYSEGITAGTSATTFDPAGKTNRAQAITFLWRYLDEPEADTENPFTDVDTNEWYGKAVAWAVANGVTEGLSENQFGVSINCNRAHMVTFLYRALA